MCKPIKFHEYDCCISIGHYLAVDSQGNLRIALTLEDPDNGEDIAVATINIPGEPLSKDEVIIKDYSENEGMLETLINASIISKPVRFVQTGHISAPICELLIKGI